MDSVAGFASIAAVGVSLQAFLETAFREVPPVSGTATTAVLVRSNDLDLAAGTVIVFPALSILLYRVDFNKTMRASWSVVGNVDGTAHLPLDLHYLLTAWADNAQHEHQSVGGAEGAVDGLGPAANQQTQRGNLQGRQG